MNDLIAIFQNVMLYLVQIKRTTMALVSLPTVLSDLFGFVGGFIDKATNYFDLLAEKLSIKYQKFKNKHPNYARFANRVSKVLGVFYDLLVSPRAWRGILIALSIAGFGLSSMGIVPIAIFALSMIGIIATTHSEAKQKVNIIKLKREEKALRSLVKQKQRSLAVAEKLGIRNAALAEQLGFKSLSRRERGFVAIPTNNDELLKIPSSLLSIKDLRKAQQAANLEHDVHKSRLLAQKITEARQIAQQKNELGYTTVSKAGIKAASGGLIGAITSLGVLSFVTSPYAVALGISSVLANYVGSGVTRYTDSNVKQALKNAVSVYRLRPDIPEYSSVEEIERAAREAKLERKVMEALEKNTEYRNLIRNIDGGGAGNAEHLIKKARAIKEATEAHILKRAEVISGGKKLKELDQVIKSRVNYLKYTKAKEIYKNRDPGGAYDKIKINATKLIIKTRLVNTLLEKNCNRSAILALIKRVDRIDDFSDLSPIYRGVKPEAILKLIKDTLESPQAKQQIDLKIFEMINLAAEIEAKKLVMEMLYKSGGKTFAEAREEVIEAGVTKLSVPDRGLNLRDRYLDREKMSGVQMYVKAIRSIFDFTSPNIAVDSNPHDLLLDNSISEFAVFSGEKSSLSKDVAKYKQRVRDVPGVIGKAVNLDSAMRSVVPILTILAVDPTNVMNTDDKINRFLHTLVSPQSSPFGSQVVSDDRLPATINNPSDNSGIVNVTFYLLFARIGQFFGAMISYGINSFRDRKVGREYHLSYDESSTTEPVERSSRTANHVQWHPVGKKAAIGGATQGTHNGFRTVASRSQDSYVRTDRVK